MIELGSIRLTHQSSVYDARNKARALATALGYDPIDVTRLATAVSEAAEPNSAPVEAMTTTMAFTDTGQISVTASYSGDDYVEPSEVTFDHLVLPNLQLLLAGNATRVFDL